MERLWQMFPTMQEGSLMPMTIAGAAIFILVSCINIVVIYRKMQQLWKHS